MLVLVTGATGEVGRRFVPRLLRHSGGPGDTVRVLVRDETRGEPFAALGAQVAVGELRDPDAVRKAVAGADAVVNIAAAFRHGEAAEEVWAVNRDAALELARAALDAGAGRFVQVSTNLVYGPGHGRPTTEDDLPDPDPAWGPYPASKAEAERELLALHREQGLDLRIGRLAYVYGEGDPHLAQSLRFAASWAAHKPMQLVHHADVAQGLMRLLRAPGVAGRTYNIADDAPASAAVLHALNGAALPEGMADRPLPDPWEGVVSTLRIRDELGFRPIYPSVWTARDAGAL
jgi:nucleoside-diphosphate-sugar epimerase